MAEQGTIDETILASAIAQLVAEHGALEGPLLPILHATQARFGYVPRDAIQLIAHALNLTRAEVYGTVSFYEDFRETPAGQHRLKLCRAEACQARGAHQLSDDIRQILGIEWGQTTPDGAITLEPVYCLGLCAVAPAAMVDGRPLGRLHKESAIDLIANLTGEGPA